MRKAAAMKPEQVASSGFHLRGLGYGLATAVGFPMALVAFAYVGELNRSAPGWLQPAIALPGFALTGVGLYGLYKSLEMDATSVIATVWVGVALGLYGTADINLTGAYFGLYAIPAAFVLITVALAIMGTVALSNETFGPFSFLPLAVAASGALWFLVLVLGAGQYKDLMRTSVLGAHIALWVILGTGLWARTLRSKPGSARGASTHPPQGPGSGRSGQSLTT